MPFRSLCHDLITVLVTLVTVNTRERALFAHSARILSESHYSLALLILRVRRLHEIVDLIKRIRDERTLRHT